ncbi:MAG: rhodanese-like domain-containing protein [Fimbriimonas sp.]
MLAHPSGSGTFIFVWHVTSFYRFTPIPEDRTEILRQETEAHMLENGVSGLIIYAPEGVNGTVAREELPLDEFKSWLNAQLSLNDIRYKDSVTERKPFHRRDVVVRREIVGLKRTDLVPDSPEDHHLSPREWHEFMLSDQPKVVIDTRNVYETAIGKFRGAVDPNIKGFSEWSQYMDQAEIPRDVPVLIYCTGGIRCEKVMLEMRTRGYDQVFQLRDGILGYLAEYPDGLYEGECYVFDDRVALDADLKPTEQYGCCPACGLPASSIANCDWCFRDYYACPECVEKWGPVCSKLCRDRYNRHGTRRPQTSSDVQG